MSALVPTTTALETRGPVRQDNFNTQLMQHLASSEETTFSDHFSCSGFFLCLRNLCKKHHQYVFNIIHSEKSDSGTIQIRKRHLKKGAQLLIKLWNMFVIFKFNNKNLLFIVPMHFVMRSFPSLRCFRWLLFLDLKLPNDPFYRSVGGSDCGSVGYNSYKWVGSFTSILLSEHLLIIDFY